jgi:hypothetical protein
VLLMLLLCCYLLGVYLCGSAEAEAAVLDLKHSLQLLSQHTVGVLCYVWVVIILFFVIRVLKQRRLCWT